ncbi:RPL21, partial [Cordylochernes scorpioides]
VKMVNTKGYRRGTRYLFSRKFKKHGIEPLSTFLTTYRRGDIVDIKGNGAFQKGMPYKYYHGKTGTVFNVTPHALGVIVNKRVRHRIIPKRINVRVEHVRLSKCRQDHLARIEKNKNLIKEAKEKGQKIRLQLKRQAVQPRGGHMVLINKTTIEVVQPIPYEFVA